MTTEILILAAGHAEPDSRDGDYPLCLADFNGVSLLEKIIDSTNHLSDCRYTFAVKKSDVSQNHINEVINLLLPRARVVQIEETTKGSACTALMAACQLPASHELLIVSANEWLDTSYQDLLVQCRKKSLDGAVFIFPSIHPRYSFVRLNDEGFVVEAAQRHPISRHATTGSFWFLRCEDFVRAATAMLRKDVRVDGNFFIAPALNEMILWQRRIGALPINPECYHPLKSDRQVHQFEIYGVH